MPVATPKALDWRRSARGQQLYVRENEWEAANTVYFWRDGGPGMNWQSSSKVPTKIDRASILSMSLAILLMQAGERCAVMGETNMPRTGRIGLERIALRLAGSTGETSNLSLRGGSIGRSSCMKRTSQLMPHSQPLILPCQATHYDGTHA